MPLLPLAPFDRTWSAAARGLWGERAAARHLWRRGWRLLAHRHTTSDRLDIDLVMSNDAAILFVEVKVRHAADENPWRDIHDPHRIQNLQTAAGHYLATTHQQTVNIRFDALLVLPIPTAPRRPRIEHEEDYINPRGVPGWRGIPPPKWVDMEPSPPGR